MTEEALRNSYARMAASALTWPIEKCKLIFQAQSTTTSSSSLPSLPSTSISTTGIHNATTTKTRTFPPPGGNRNSSNALIGVARRFVSLPWTHHIIGISSSSVQRGGSAFLMFYVQSSIYDNTIIRRPSHDQQRIQQHEHCNGNYHYICDQTVAGVFSGMVTAPFHTYWELIKVRGSLPTSTRMYVLALLPMTYRHAIFDGLFFGTQATLTQLGGVKPQPLGVSQVHPSDVVTPEKVQEVGGWNADMVLHQLSSSSGVRFGISAAVASLGNLLWDVWKTRQMSVPSTLTPSTVLSKIGHPIRRIYFFRDIVQTMTVQCFWRQYLVKGTDLTANWFVRTLLYCVELKKG